jgi:putative Ig domain-containing protein
VHQALAQILSAALQVHVILAFYNVRVLRPKRPVLLLLLFVAAFARPHATGQQFAITTSGLPNGVVGDAYSFELQSSNGLAPVVWQASDGQLPPGIRLDSKTGVIGGTPTQIGTYVFTVHASDQSNSTVSRRYVVNIGTRTLNIIWRDYPKVESTAINGGVEVSNPSDDTYDLTVIIVAVDEHDKAWALGYQHFSFSGGSRQRIPFGSTLPDGNYVVNADAVGEIVSKDVIRRARINTPQALSVHTLTTEPIGSRLR